LKLLDFQITNYRNILDSGIVPVGKIAALVGQNECGKSNLLEALYKLNPFQPANYNLSSDWPIDRWAEQDPSAMVCAARFEIEDADLEKLFSAAPPVEPRTASLARPLLVTVRKGYSNKLDCEWNQVITGILDDSKANAWVQMNMPKCVYMDDYATFEGRAELDQLITKIDQNGGDGRGEAALNERERTILITLQLAALKLRDLHGKSGAPQNRSIRGFDTSAASRHLTQQFKQKWRQKAVKFNIRVDGPTLDILVEDQGLEAFIPLQQRSRGFQWYVSFIWRFTYASRGQFANCILLLDEPGVHLHHEGHRDLIEFFNSLTETNQLIFTTHLSTMLDLGQPEAIKIVEVRDHHASVRNSMVSSQRVPMMVIEQALGLSAGMSGLLGARKNVVVEGITDVLVIHKLAGVIEKSGGQGIRDDVYLIPAKGASKTPMYAGFMMGNRIPSAILLDSDEAGEEARKKIGELRVLGTDDTTVPIPKVLMLGKVMGDSAVVEIEDVFPLGFYIDCVNEAYGTNLREADLPEVGNTSAAARIESALKAKGRATALDKELIAAVLQRRFQSMHVKDDLPPGTENKAAKLIAAINAAF
jgi:energy-coupling factor transporter ATP-binding protein EcfA2